MAFELDESDVKDAGAARAKMDRFTRVEDEIFAGSKSQLEASVWLIEMEIYWDTERVYG